MLFVFDTNTLASALLRSDSLPASAVKHAMQKGGIIFSKETELEYLEVIAREKFNKYLTSEQGFNNAKELIKQSEIKIVTIHLIGVCEDADDIKFLNMALEWGTTCLISGDKHSKDLNPFRGIPILSPGDFLKIF